MALGGDYRKATVCGGFVPNFRGTMLFSPEMDIVDNPHMINELKGVRDISVTHRHYLPPPPMKTGLDHLPRNCAPSDSGFTRARATHIPDTMDILRVDRARSLMSNSAQVQTNCRVPAYMATTETHEAFNPEVLKRTIPIWQTDFPGSKDSGFIHAFAPNTLDGRIMDPIYCGSPPDMGRVGPSVTHQDYLPIRLKSGSEYTQPLCQLGRTTTGFNRFTELQPCFGDNSWKGPCRTLETSYNHDYYKKSSLCDTHGKKIVGKGFKISGNSGDMNLFEGPGYYISEAMERYTSPLPEGRARHGHLRGAVDNFNQTSGFIMGTKTHIPSLDPCRSHKMDDRSNGPLDPCRYNPWPRYLAGHQGLIQKNYRPNPYTEPGTDFQLIRVEPGSIYKDFSALI